MFFKKNNYKRLIYITKKLHELAPTLTTSVIDQFYKRSSYQSIYIKELNCIYMPIPKVASQSFKKMFANYYSKIHSDQRFNIKRNKKWGLPFNRISKIEADVLSDDVFVFSFVRNPYKRILSCYLDKIKNPTTYLGFLRYGNRFYKEMSFEDFLEEIYKIPDSEADKHFRSQHTFLMNEEEFIPHFIGNLETIPRDFERLLNKIGTDKLEITHKRRTKSHKNRKDFFTPKAKELIRERYRKDFLYLNYSENIKEGTTKNI